MCPGVQFGHSVPKSGCPSSAEPANEIVNERYCDQRDHRIRRKLQHRQVLRTVSIRFVERTARSGRSAPEAAIRANVRISRALAGSSQSAFPP